MGSASELLVGGLGRPSSLAAACAAVGAVSSSVDGLGWGAAGAGDVGGAGVAAVDATKYRKPTEDGQDDQCVGRSVCLRQRRKRRLVWLASTTSNASSRTSVHMDTLALAGSAAGGREAGVHPKIVQAINRKTIIQPSYRTCSTSNGCFCALARKSDGLRGCGASALPAVGTAVMS